MQRVNLHARPSYYTGGVSHLLLSGVCTGPCKGGTVDLDYPSEPCHRNVVAQWFHTVPRYIRKCQFSYPWVARDVIKGPQPFGSFALQSLVIILATFLSPFLLQDEAMRNFPEAQLEPLIPNFGFRLRERFINVQLIFHTSLETGEGSLKPLMPVPIKRCDLAYVGNPTAETKDPKMVPHFDIQLSQKVYFCYHINS